MTEKKKRKKLSSQQTAKVAVIMGSRSDWETMQHAVEVLDQFSVPCAVEIVSAHRTPDKLTSFAKGAISAGLRVVIAGAGGAAHLPGMVAAQTTLPVFGVPVQSKTLQGIDSLLSIVQMPAGIPVPTLAIGKAGATNAGLAAIAVLALSDEELHKKLVDYRSSQTERVLKDRLKK